MEVISLLVMTAFIDQMFKFWSKISMVQWGQESWSKHTLWCVVHKTLQMAL
jgi:hypothetical protein